MNPLVVAHICILHIIFLVLSPRLQGGLSPFNPCDHCCHELLITATATQWVDVRDLSLVSRHLGQKNNRFFYFNLIFKLISCAFQKHILPLQK